MARIREKTLKFPGLDNVYTFADEADLFDANVDCAVGEYRIYAGDLYRCTVAHTGAWNASHFKAVKIGSEVSGLKTALTTIEEVEWVNIPFVNDGNGYIRHSNGTVVGASGTLNAHTNYIDVSKYEFLEYKIQGYTEETTNAGMAFYDAQKTFISGKQGKGGEETAGYTSWLDGVLVPDNAVYARFTIYQDTTTYGNFEVKGQPRNIYLLDAATSNSYGLNPYGLEPFQLSLFKPTANLFSDLCYHITGGYYRYRINKDILPRITLTSNWQGWLIRVKPNTVYTLGQLDFKIELLDFNFYLDKSIGEISDSSTNTITTGENSYWLCLTQRMTRDMSDWMMVEGDTYPSEYISGYPEWVANPKDAPINKTIAFMGDSITAGVATAYIYHQYLHDKFGFTCLNYGYGGSGYYLSTNTTSSGKLGTGNEGMGVPITAENAFQPNNVAARLTELDASTIDGIVIFAGTNDWHHDISVNDLTSAIDTAFEYCQTNFTAKPVLVMLPIHRKDDTVVNNIGKTLRDYCDIIVEECKKYSIPYVDTMTMSGLYPDNQANRLLYFKNNSESGLHPSEEGHQRIASVVGNTLKEIVEYDSY